MIIFEKVSWRNFLSTGDAPTTVLLDRSSTTLIIGENGSGKSTILDALTFALFGKPFRNINKAQLINTINEKGLLVEIDFIIGKRKYTIRRGIKPNKFEILQDGKLIDQLANNRDYQDYLEKVILKLNYKSFTQIVVLGNSSFEPFMQLKQSDRRTIVEDLLDIQIFSSMNGILKSKNSELKNDMGTLEIEKGLYKQKIEIQEDYIERLKEDSKSVISQKEKEIERFETEKETAKTKIDVLQSEIGTLGEKLSDENSIKKKSADYEKVQDQIEYKLKQEETEISFYETNSTCSTCKQVIDDEFKKERVIDISKKMDEKKDGLDKIQTEIDTLEKTLKEYREIGGQVVEKNKQLVVTQSKMESLAENIHRIEREINKLKNEKKNDSSIEKELNILKENLEQSLQDYAKLSEQKKLHEYAHELLRDSGIKTKIIRQYVPIINKYVNKYLNELDFLINFSIDENFNETIQSQYRDEFSYASFSEGEKMRIDLALLFTWRMVAKLKNSVNTNLLILDEVFDSSLDAEGTDAFLKIINTLDANTNVFVISHKGEILFDKFISTIKFTKEKQFSKIEAT
jgi:DNA repair exonuclease SbcCD ATPase subunit